MSGTAMGAPRLPTITGAVVGKTSIKLTLGATPSGGSPITGYAYSLGSKVWTNFALVDEQFTIDGLKAGVTYRIYIRAINVTGNGTAAVTLIRTIK
jgi:hypothetical protein